MKAKRSEVRTKEKGIIPPKKGGSLQKRRGLWQNVKFGLRFDKKNITKRVRTGEGGPKEKAQFFIEEEICNRIENGGGIRLFGDVWRY